MSIHGLLTTVRLRMRQVQTQFFLSRAVRHGERADWIDEILIRAEGSGWKISEDHRQTAEFLKTLQHLKAQNALRSACEIEEKTFADLCAEKLVQR